MTRNAELVLNGFFGLTDQEKAEVVGKINEYYEKQNTTSRKAMKEDFEKRATARLQLGPVSSPSCPCCHR